MIKEIDNQIEQEKTEESKELPEETSTRDSSEVELVSVEEGKVGRDGEVEPGEGEVEGSEAVQFGDGVSEFGALVEMGASAAQELLGEEAAGLERERTRQTRAAAAVSNTMYKEAQVYVVKQY